MRILTNAQIFTLDPRQPQASEIALEDGKVLAVGTNLSQTARSGVAVEDMGGRVILPGLIDAHIHLKQYAFNLTKIDCETSTKQACLDRVHEQAEHTPPGQWIFGHGWNQNQWQGEFGTAVELDQAAPRNPVYLTAKSLHAGWANSLALEKAGIRKKTSDPEAGKISRTSEGEPDGVLFENAMLLVEKVLPEPTRAAVVEALLQGQEPLWKMGLTGVHDFDRRQCFAALQTLQSRGELKLRVLKQVHHTNFKQALQLGLQSGFGGPRLSIGGAKFFSDGALGPQTAALLAPYQGQATRGIPLLNQESLEEIGRKAVDGGLSLSVHAIGDSANRLVLNALEAIRKYEQMHGLSPFRHRIEHVQLLHPKDLHRLAALDIIASMQPIHATSDMETAERFWGDRCRYAYAWKSQLLQGARLAFGSDAPVESPNPFWGIHAAVTRRRRDGTPGPCGWIPEERLSTREALEAYTKGAAYAAGWENQAGKLAPGFWADLIILDQNPFTIDPEQLHTLRPVGTIFAGTFVWRDF